jgi:hypothetical protein
MAGRYDDIIGLERPVSKRHSPMPMAERAAQFSPFAALTGYEEVIAEAARLTARKIELSEDAMQELNDTLQELTRQIEASGGPVSAEVTWFEPDGLKLGGEYRTQRLTVRRVDHTYCLLELEDRSVIPIDAVLNLRLLDD